MAAVIGLMTLTAPDGLNIGYFEVVAQVIPALLIVLALERQLLQNIQARRRPLASTFVRVNLGLLFMGETMALFAVATDRTFALGFAVTSAAVFLSFGVLFLPFAGFDQEAHGRTTHLVPDPD